MNSNVNLILIIILCATFQWTLQVGLNIVLEVIKWSHKVNSKHDLYQLQVIIQEILGEQIQVYIKVFITQPEVLTADCRKLISSISGKYVDFPGPPWCKDHTKPYFQKKMPKKRDTLFFIRTFNISLPRTSKLSKKIYVFLTPKDILWGVFGLPKIR